MDNKKMQPTKKAGEVPPNRNFVGAFLSADF